MRSKRSAADCGSRRKPEREVGRPSSFQTALQRPEAAARPALRDRLDAILGVALEVGAGAMGFEVRLGAILLIDEELPRTTFGPPPALASIPGVAAPPRKVVVAKITTAKSSTQPAPRFLPSFIAVLLRLE